MYDPHSGRGLPDQVLIAHAPPGDSLKVSQNFAHVTWHPDTGLTLPTAHHAPRHPRVQWPPPPPPAAPPPALTHCPRRPNLDRPLDTAPRPARPVIGIRRPSALTL